MSTPIYRGPRAQETRSSLASNDPIKYHRRKKNKRSWCTGRIHPIFVTVFLSVLSYYGGYYSFGQNVISKHCLKLEEEEKVRAYGNLLDVRSQVLDEGGSVHDIIDSKVKERVETALSRRRTQEENNQKKNNSRDKKDKNSQPAWPEFPRASSRVAVGIAVVDKLDFHKTFNYGTPSAPLHKKGMEDVLLLYNADGSLPNNYRENLPPSTSSQGRDIPRLTAQEATAKCNAMNVVYQNPPSLKHCWAIVENYQNHHLQKWITFDDDPTRSLTAVGKGVKANGRNEFESPRFDDIKNYNEIFKRFLNSHEEVLKELEPIAKGVAMNGSTIVVMTTNYGQADLLANFVCSARRRGLEDALKSVLVFATDEKSESVARGLGLAVFYDQKNFGHLSEKEAGAYGDKTFGDMMYAKVVSVQLINMLNYDLLFQDVDVVWNRNPIPYLENLQNPAQTDHHYDMLFQDDGSRSIRFGDAFGNSGFYYVRSNPYTRYLLTSMLYEGPMLLKSRSHQSVLMSKVNEFASSFGLHVGVLEKEDFPCGAEYHREGALMREIVKGEKEPFLFHMSWTHNKANKVLFMKQMGMWYMQEQCMGTDMLQSINVAGLKVDLEENVDNCCAVEALVSCHYMDKPSVIPCKDSPPIDEGGKSFW